MSLLFEWDPSEARSNSAKHGVTFDEASSVFKDRLSVTIPDPLHSGDEERFVLLGRSHANRLLVVAHTYRGGRIRIISARPAIRKERIHHEENGE